MTIPKGRILLNFIPDKMRGQLGIDFNFIDLIDYFKEIRPRNATEDQKCKDLEKLKILVHDPKTGTYQTSPIIHHILEDYAP